MLPPTPEKKKKTYQKNCTAECREKLESNLFRFFFFKSVPTG